LMTCGSSLENFNEVRCAKRTNCEAYSTLHGGRLPSV